MERVTVTSPEELCALVEERVLGRSLKPHRDVAMVAVGWRYVAVTGNPFTLTTGEQLLMPHGSKLPQPHGTDGWNARYSYYVAQHLGDRIKDEVEAYRLKPRNLLTWAGMGLVVEAMRTGVPPLLLVLDDCAPEFFAARFYEPSPDVIVLLRGEAQHADAPTAVLLAALRAKGIDVDYRPGEEGRG